ncbi:uncharacterized protein LOC142323170 isoform X1 [Lycorma delicatula]|uniref:uncharacterized protein LOC142323170 isoform X1 n=1 Tax=Lycorma delicatula TaxID=130591 RepID=UPI003F519705
MERLYAVIQMISLFEVFLFNVFLTIAFMVWFPNVEAGVWTFLSAPLNLGVIHLHHLYLSDKISDWHDDLTLGSIMKLGFISFVISCGCAFWHVFAYCYYDSNLCFLDSSNAICASFVTLHGLWSIILYLTAEHYVNYVPMFHPHPSLSDILENQPIPRHVEGSEDLDASCSNTDVGGGNLINIDLTSADETHASTVNASTEIQNGQHCEGEPSYAVPEGRVWSEPINIDKSSNE